MTSAPSGHRKIGPTNTTFATAEAAYLKRKSCSCCRVYGEEPDAVQMPDDEEGMTAMIFDLDGRIKRLQANIEAVSVENTQRWSDSVTCCDWMLCA